MNPPSRPPSDDEIDRLLASRFKDSTPAFEARWRDLKRELRQQPRRPTHFWLLRPLPLLGAAAGLAAALFLLLHPPARPPVADPVPPELALLFELERDLSPAAPLLDPENRDVLLEIPLHADS